MKYMYIAVGLFVVLAALVGFVFPLLMSAKSTTAVMIGISSMLAIILVSVHMGVNFYNKMKGKKNVEKSS